MTRYAFDVWHVLSTLALIGVVGWAVLMTITLGPAEAMVVGGGVCVVAFKRQASKARAAARGVRLMARYQCPLCEAFHPDDLKPRCSVHGRDGYSPRCEECVRSAANPPCAVGVS